MVPVLHVRYCDSSLIRQGIRFRALDELVHHDHDIFISQDIYGNAFERATNIILAPGA